MYLLVNKKELRDLKTCINKMVSLTLSERQICDLELLLNGGFYPLKGFFNEEDYHSVLDNMRLKTGKIWPIPINLDISEKLSELISIGDEIALRDKEGFALAIMNVESKWKVDKAFEAQSIFGTSDLMHPGVNFLQNNINQIYIGGSVKGLLLPKHYDYQLLRMTPEDLKNKFSNLGWGKVVAFQTRNPMHRAHVEITRQASKEKNASLLIHPVVGMTKPGDFDYFTRVRCYEKIIEKYPDNTAMLSLLPLAMRMAGPREALWHAIIRKNYGCTHLIVGRDHAGPGKDSKGNSFYGPYDAQELLKNYEKEIGVEMVPFKMMVYVKEEQQYFSIDAVSDTQTKLEVSGTELKKRLDLDEEIPEWFSYKDVLMELKKSHPPLKERGFTVFFTGLSGSGKSTLANGLLIKLLELGNRPVTLLDGDIVRTHLSSELGFSKEHRSINIKRIGFVASEITKNRGIAVCAPIAPYISDRDAVRDIVSAYGGFIEIHVSTPLEVCERRDVKGLYAKARQGIIKEFTGISDPYELPKSPEIIIDSSSDDPEILVQNIMEKIEEFGYI
tara:strand:+ start:681 stop:2354 length:1674 start_codon:yes stop_codon:yes gene_type:complete